MAKFAMSRGITADTINKTEQIQGDETYLYQPQAPMQQLYQNQMTLISHATQNRPGLVLLSKPGYEKNPAKWIAYKALQSWDS